MNVVVTKIKKKKKQYFIYYTETELNKGRNIFYTII